jgi:hemoglobin
MVKVPVQGPGGDSVFAKVGGRPFFDDLAARFYAAVETDPVLRPLYPDDLTDSIVHTAGFLAQYWGGGSSHYSDERGHPRLRMRHAHIAIGMEQRDAWFRHMTDAVRASGLSPELETAFIEYFEMATMHLINATE